MNLYISVINHHHDNIICASDTLRNLSKQHVVVIRSNTEPTEMLKRYSKGSGIYLVKGSKPLGFASNNNAVFKYCKEKFNMTADDNFLVLNPDVDISLAKLNELLLLSYEYNADISAINLFRDNSFKYYDNSIRRRPRLLSPLKSLFGVKRDDIYDKSRITKPIKIEWAAGSFLLFKVNCFERLRGFDEKFFMYFEDTDICTRANIKNFNVFYFPEIKAIHYASLKNRNILSKHFIWYVISAVYYHTKHRTINK